MNQINPSTSPEESQKFPVKTLLIALVILAAAVAILVFKVPVTTVLTFGFLGFMLFGHLFMHGGHGAHDGHGQSASPYEQSGDQAHNHPDSAQISQHSHADGPAQPGNPKTKSEKDQDSHQGHSGCC